MLSHDNLRKLTAEVIDCQIERKVLLSGIKPRLVSQITQANNLAGQILNDVLFLHNQLIEGHMDSFHTWLTNAIYFCRSESSKKVFEEVLNLIEKKSSQNTYVKQQKEITSFPPAFGILNYQKHLERIISNHGYILPFARTNESLLDISDIFVDLDLFAPWTAEKSPDNFNLIPQKFSFHECLLKDQSNWSTKKWILLGDPGSGKTTLMRRAVFVLATSETKKRPVLPCFIKIANIQRTILESLSQELNIQNSISFEELIQIIDVEFDSYLFFDGFDEIGIEERNILSEQLIELASKMKNTTIVVSSRHIGYKSPGSIFREIHISPLDVEKRKKLLIQIISANQASYESILTEIQEDKRLWTLCENPLLLTLIAFVSVKQSLRGETRAKILEHIINLLLSSQHRNERSSQLPHLSEVKRILGDIALRMICEGHISLSESQIVDLIFNFSSKSDIDVIQKQVKWTGDVSVFLQYLAKNTGIISIENQPIPEWRFWHRSIQEALAAEGLERILKKEGIDFIISLIINSNSSLDFWIEPLALLAGRIRKSGDLILKIWEFNSQAGLSALKNVGSLDLNTINKLLLKNPSGPLKSAVIAEIPRLIADPLEALDIILEFSKTTRNGNDLYWALRSAKIILTLLDAPKELEEEVNHRIFKHLPNPNDIHTLTPKWLEELWKKVSYGKFIMGCDLDGNPDESPSHLVTISKNFEIMAIPVTKRMYALFSGGLIDELEADKPQTGISWYEARVFALWLGGDLPTEAQWEYCCRAGTDTKWFIGNTSEQLNNYAWFDNRDPKASSNLVAKKFPNSWGIYDMCGNVWEWCFDFYGLYNNLSSYIDPQGPKNGDRRVMRGGSYWTPADRLRSSFRSNGLPFISTAGTGFRIIRSI